MPSERNPFRFLSVKQRIFQANEQRQGPMWLAAHGVISRDHRLHSFQGGAPPLLAGPLRMASHHQLQVSSDNGSPLILFIFPLRFFALPNAFGLKFFKQKLHQKGRVLLLGRGKTFTLILLKEHYFLSSKHTKLVGGHWYLEKTRLSQLKLEKCTHGE